MAEDVAPKILEDLQNQIDKSSAEKRQEARLIVKAEKGNATFQDAQQYAKLRGQDVGNAIRQISSLDLPNGEMYYNIADRAIRPVLEEMTDDVMQYAADVVKAANQKAGIGLNSLLPDEDEKIHGVVNACTGRPWDEAKNEVATACETLSRKTVDDTVQKNAEFQHDAGLVPKVIRTASSKACDWCSDVAGTYDYDEVKATGNDVWRRHANCDCVVEFQPAKGNRQLVSNNRFGQNRNSLSPEERERRAEEQLFNTRRRTAADGHEIIDKPTYNKVTESFLKNDGVIIRGEEAARHLKNQGASAAYIVGANTAIIRDDATVSDVLEEMRHAFQDRTGMFGREINERVFLQREIEAQKYLISVEKKYKIPVSEMEDTRKALKYYMEKLSGLDE